MSATTALVPVGVILLLAAVALGLCSPVIAGLYLLVRLSRRGTAGSGGRGWLIPLVVVLAVVSVPVGLIMFGLAGSNLSRSTSSTSSQPASPAPAGQVPDVVGQGETSALEALQAVGLQVNIVRVIDAASVGTVVAQDPPAGYYAPTDQVTITVSVGPGHRSSSGSPPSPSAPSASAS